MASLNIRDFTLQQSIVSAKNVGKCFATKPDFLESRRFTLGRIYVLGAVNGENHFHGLLYALKGTFTGQKSRMFQM